MFIKYLCQNFICNFRLEQDENGTCHLVLDRASRRDDGWITCTAFNKAGRVACRAKLTVKSEFSYNKFAIS